jgi:hypothetical protein
MSLQGHCISIFSKKFFEIFLLEIFIFYIFLGVVFARRTEETFKMEVVQYYSGGSQKGCHQFWI